MPRVRSQRMNLAVILVGVDVYSSLYLKIESCDWCFVVCVCKFSTFSAWKSRVGVQDVQKAKAKHRSRAHKFECRHLQQPSYQFVPPTAFDLELEDQAGSEYDSDPEPAQRSFFPVVDHRMSVYSGSKSHHGVLTEQSAQNRQQRCLESASHRFCYIKAQIPSNRHNG